MDIIKKENPGLFSFGPNTRSDDKPIQISGASEPIHMVWAFKAKENFLKWEGRNWRTERGESAMQKTIVTERRGICKKSVWDIFVYETPDTFAVKISRRNNVCH